MILDQDEEATLESTDDSSTSSFTDGDIDESPTLDLGDYEVGKDINAGTYNVELTFRDDSMTLLAGIGKIIITPTSGDSRTYTFEADDGGYSDEQRLILKKGDIITLSADKGVKSDFDFETDDD